MKTATIHPFNTWRKRGVPLGAIETADPAAAIIACQKSMNGKADGIKWLEWDCVRGLRGLNDSGNAAAATVAGEQSPEMLTNPTETLAMLAKNCPSDSVIFFHGQDFLSQAPVSQGVWNCRDVFKSSDRHCTLILMGSQIKIPESLRHDVLTHVEDLPDSEQIGAIIDETLSNAEIEPAKINRQRVIDTLRGLSAYAVEQILAVSIVKDGVNMDSLWSRKRQMIEQTPGLEVWQGGETFEDLGGLANLKDFLTRIVTSSNTPIRAVLYLDEIEKSLAGAAGDSSGTSQDQLGVLLKVMQDQNLPGVILVGHAGTGKSSIAKAAGNAADAPVIACDLGAMKGSLVGASEARIRAAMSVFQAVSQGKGMAIATCNQISQLPPPLRRRFTLGTFFVDLPDRVEQAVIWPLWMKRFQIADQPLPDCDGWTGAEIRACCEVSFRAGFTLLEASRYVVPVIKSAPDAVRALRQLAHGRFINASKPGVYQMPIDSQVSTGGNRKIEI